MKNTVDRGSAENFGPDSGLCMSRSSDCGSDHSFSVGLGQFFGVLSTNLIFSVLTFFFGITSSVVTSSGPLR